MCKLKCLMLTLYIPDGVGEVDVDDGEADDGIVIVGECCAAV